MLSQGEVVFLHKLINRSSFIICYIRLEWKIEFFEAWSQWRNTAMLFLEFLIQEKTKINLLRSICPLLLFFRILIKLLCLLNRIHSIWAGTYAPENFLWVKSRSCDLRSHQQFMIIEYRWYLLVLILLYQCVKFRRVRHSHGLLGI